MLVYLLPAILGFLIILAVCIAVIVVRRVRK